jgi:hypothetical protein
MEETNKETGRRMEETNRRMEETNKETGRRMEETNKETNRRMEERDVRIERNLEEMRVQAEKDRQEAKRERGELARQLGEISNRMGTIVEDIIAPSLRRMAEDELECGEIETFALRIEQRHPVSRQRREFDVIVVGSKAVLLNETKATVKPEYAADFVEFLRSGEFFVYFPAYKGKPLIPVFSSLYLPENIVTYLTRHGIYAVGMGEEAMEVLNLEQVRANR